MEHRSTLFESMGYVDWAYRYTQRELGSEVALAEEADRFPPEPH